MILRYRIEKIEPAVEVVPKGSTSLTDLRISLCPLWGMKKNRYTPDQIREIRTRYATTQVTLAALAREYQCASGMISQIVTGTVYRACGGPLRPPQTQTQTPAQQPAQQPPKALEIVTPEAVITIRVEARPR